MGYYNRMKELGKCVVDKFLYEEWEFDTSETLECAIKKEARVCGDKIQWNSNNEAVIYNYHQCGIRWIGKV